MAEDNRYMIECPECDDGWLYVRVDVDVWKPLKECEKCEHGYIQALCDGCGEPLTSDNFGKSIKKSWRVGKYNYCKGCL